MSALWRQILCVFFLPFLISVASAEDSSPRYHVDRAGEGILARELRTNRTWPHQDMAYRLQAQGDLHGAARELQAFLDVDPLEDNVRLQLVTLLERLGDNQGVVTEAGRLARNRPDDFLPFLYRAQALERQGRRDLARADYRHVLAMPGLDPARKTDIALALAHSAQVAGDHAGVLEALEAGGGDLPAQADYLRGLALSALGRHTQALESLESAAARAATDEDRVAALRAAAEEAIRMGAADKAHALLLRSIGNGATTPEVESRLAELARQAGWTGKTAEHLRALALDHESTPAQKLSAWERLGHVLVAMGRRDEAEQAWLTALDLSGTRPRPDLLAALGDNAWMDGLHERAGGYYEQAWEAGGRRDMSLARRAATAWVRAKRPDRALELYAALARDPALPAPERKTALESIAHLRRQSGESASAAEALLLAARLDGLDSGARGELLERATALLLEAGNMAQVQTLFRERLRTLPKGPARARLLLTMAELEESQAGSGWPGRAVELLAQAEGQPGLDNELAGRVADALVRACRARKDFRGAAHALERAIALVGETSRWRLELGYLYTDLGEHARARDNFERAVLLGAGDRASLGLAQAYQRLGQLGLALHVLERAPFAANPARLSGADRVVALGLLGYLNEELRRPAQAAAWYGQALEAGDDPLIRFRLARVLCALGQAERAEGYLRGVASEALPPEERVSEVMLRARLARALGREDQAEAIYRRALDSAPRADLWYELGDLLRHRGRHAEAAKAFAQALTLHDIPAYHVDLGYEFQAQERDQEAVRALDDGVRAAPDYLLARQDLAYAAMRLGWNELAVEHFMKAIDTVPLRPVPNSSAAVAVAEDARRMRGEVRALTNALDADAWLTYSSGKTGALQSGGGSLEQDVVRTSSGVELGWIPPNWGFRDHRIFKFIGRLAWNMEPDSLEIRDDSWDAALGVRYKPFKSQNLNLGLERLFSLSGQGEDNWVARAMYSLSEGVDDLEIGKNVWNYSFLFGEADAYLESPSRLTVYAEARRGLTWRIDDNLLVSPFAMADAKWWSDSSANDVSFYEGGLGVSARHYFDEDKYTLPRRSLELLMTYKLGRIFEADNIKDEDINAFFATVLFRF